MTQPITDATQESPQESGAEDKRARKANKEKKREKQREKADRRHGVETMFRIAYQNHLALSQLADQKFGMLININGLIISVLLGLLTPKFGDWSSMLAPGVTLALGSLVSLAFAVIGSRPRFERTPITVDDVRNNQGNVLFFGHFSSMELGDFQAAIRVLGKHPKLLKDALARQLHAMGDPLAKKYRYLRFAYSAFLAGVLLSAVVFAAVVLKSAGL
jgi:hypothetical protein